jgi:predicted ATPase
VLGEATALVGQGERVHEAEVHRATGELLLTVGRRSEAVARLLRAVEVARAQGARSWELRAAASLARAWAAGRGERGEARDLLAPVYGRFAEGFATPDLRDAEGLLAALA